MGYFNKWSDLSQRPKRRGKRGGGGGLELEEKKVKEDGICLVLGTSTPEAFQYILKGRHPQKTTSE